jgi:hypothetical protein
MQQNSVKILKIHGITLSGYSKRKQRGYRLEKPGVLEIVGMPPKEYKDSNVETT